MVEIFEKDMVEKVKKSLGLEEDTTQTHISIERPPVRISASVSARFWELARDHNIGWSEALRVGISILLADRDVIQYDNSLNLYRKMRFFQTKAEEYGQKYHDLLEKAMDLEERKSKKEEKQNGNNNKKI